MAKGSNNPRGRSSAASKPYDVSNSFVKRVASRVTELLPQPSSWFSRWMSPASVTNSSEFINHTVSTSRPAATSRADLNLISADDIDHHVPAKRARTNQYGSPVSQNNFLNNDIYDPEELSPIPVRAEPAAVPGPSNARPDFIASTPAVPVQQQQTSTKINGDDCSETSESTSGCSSLVPQAQSTIRSLADPYGHILKNVAKDFQVIPGSFSRKSTKGGSRFANSLSQAMNVDSLHRRRPSFSTTTFTSPLRSSMRERLGSSPFYSGRTMYGGSAQAYVSMVHSPQRRVRPNVKPAPATQSSQPLSSTAKCILDALEQFSSPVMDARRIPVSTGTKRKLEATQRYAELSIPSTPDLLRVKRRERLQQSTSAARQTATTPVHLTSRPEPPRDYTLRKEDDEEEKKHTGKVKTKEIVDEELLVEVKLPSVALTVDKLPKIDIAIPPPPPVIIISKPKTGLSSISCSVTSSQFTFSSPTVVPVTFSSSVNVSTPSFTFSRPIGETSSMRSEVNSRTCRGESPKSIDIKSAVTTLNSLANTATSTSIQSACKVCKAKLDNPSSPCLSCKSAASQRNAVKPKPDFADLLKKQTGGTWECSVCMIRNKNDASRCVACETLKPAPKAAVEAAKPAVSTPGSGFGDLFKKPTGSWECDACMVRNEPSCTQCVACETPKPGTKVSNEPKPLAVPAATGPGFGDMFKKPAGSWACKECMVTNNADKLKCVACETVKPGAIIPKTSETSAPKFSFGIPSSATSTSGPSTTFSFGVNNADQTKPAATVSNEVSALKNKSDASVPSQTFQFGIPKSSKVENDDKPEVSSSNLTKPTFQFGSNSATTAVDTKFSFGSSSTTSKPSAAENLFGSVNKRKLDEDTKSESASPSFGLSNKLAPAVAVSVKSESPKLLNNISEKSTLGKTSSAPSPIFSFGSNNSQSLGDKAAVNSVTKPFQLGFMSKANEGSSFPSSTTNTLSTSVSSNVFKFGETKTVHSGSTSPSVSAVSSQPSLATAISKANNIFSFGSTGSTEKKDITYGTTKTTDTQLVNNLITSAEVSKPSFGAFSTTATPAFGSANANPTFGTAGAFNMKKDQPSPFAPQSTSTNMFGMTEAPIVTPSTTFSTFTQNNAFATVTQENKPSPVFAFGATAPKETTPAPVGGFSFPVDPVVEKPAATTFNFGGAQTNPVPNMFNSAASSAPSATFNFEPKGFGNTVTPSPFSVSNDIGTSPFGPTVLQQAPAFGEQTAPTAPVFAFGSQSAPAPAAPVFNFPTNQVAPAASTTFQFGATNSTPAQPTFDPTAKPTFNFSQGTATQVFTAVPTVNPVTPQQPVQRKIRKAVRRANVTARQN